MSKIISEENPAAQQSAAPQGQGAGGAQDKVRRQARQLAYDVRYKVKQGFKDGQKTDPASLKTAFMSQLGKSPAPGPVKQLAKKMLVGEAYDFTDINETVGKSISSAVGKVFVKTIEVDDADGNPAFEITDLVVKEDLGERKYKVRVTDKKSGKSYTRMATRPKISELRKNPNISSVEMTGYGTPYEGEKKKGSQTAAVKSGKGLAKKDFDGDGKVESPTAEYKGSKDKAIKKALHREEFIDEVNTEDANPQANTKRIDVMKGKNKIKINPNMGEQTEMGTEKPQEDPREKRIRLIKRQILQKKQQAVRTGAGTDVQASHTPEGDVISEKQKDTPDQVKAVIAFDKARKGTDDATYDSEHGKKKQAKKERDYAKWQRDKGAEDAQKSGHPWEHAKGSTREKEGKKSEKHAHIKDDKDWGYDKKGNSLNPVDIEKKKRKDDGLFGSPNAKKKVKEDYENEPPIKDQTDKQLASVTFDGGGPDGGATITGTGDPREIPTFVTLIKQKLRARGILVSHHVPEGEVVSEKKAAKDYDGDGKVESGKDEYFGSKDKAIKKAMGKKHDCASKVKHEEYGLGDCIKGMHDLDESGNVAHYDVFFEHGIEKDVDVSSLEILEYKMHEHVIRDGDTIEESEAVAQGAQKRATELGAKRRQASYKKYGSNVGSPGKNERAGYNLARKASSAASSPETQVTKKKKPAGFDTSQMGHERKRDEKTDTGKSGKKLKTPKYKLSFKDRQTHHTRSAFNRKDPKQNPKHTANEGYQRDPEQQEKERKTSKQSDPSKDNFTGISGSIATIMKQNAAMKKAAAKKVKKEEVETIDELKSTTLLSYSNKAANELAFKGDGGKKAQKRATGVKRAAGQLTMKAINKEEYDNTKSPDYAKKKKALAKKHGGADKVKGHPQYESIVQSAVDALDRFSLKKD